MAEKKKLNSDIGSSISQLMAIIKQFEKRQKLYQIIIRGKGLEFESYRNFTPDDDANLIDWKASKRANKLLTKQFKREKDLKVVFMIDMSENMVLGSTEKLKCEYAAEVAGALSYLVMDTGNMAGFIFFNDGVKTYFRPSRGKKHFGMILDYLTSAENYGGSANLKTALDFSIDYIPETISSMIIISDFASFDDKIKKSISLVGKKFETLLLSIKDPLDKTLPNISGEVVIEDPNTGQQVLVNPALAKKVYESQIAKKEKEFRQFCLENNIDLLELMTDKQFAYTLATFLKERVKGRRIV